MKGLWYRAVACCTALILLLIAVPGARADSVDTKREELSQLQQDEKELQDKIDALGDTLEDQQAKVTGLYQQVNNQERQIEAYESQITLVDEDIAEADARIAELTDQIAAKERLMEEILTKLKKRVKAITKTGNYSSFQMLMSTENYEDYLLKSQVIKCVSEHDADLCAKAEEEKQAIAEKRAQAEDEKAQREADKVELETLKAELDSKFLSLETLYQTAYNEKVKLEKQLGTYESEQQKLKKAEDDLEKEIERLLKGDSGSSSATYGGTMHWPVPGIYRISSPYGQRDFDFHKGTDISAAGVLKKPIVAAADGVVFKASATEHYSYGYYVVIDHGYNANGIRIMTLYAHMYSPPEVSVGQTVVGGQTQIGRVGNTGNSFGAHLHFEVREIVNGVTNRVDAVGKGYIALP